MIIDYYVPHTYYGLLVVGAVLVLLARRLVPIPYAVLWAYAFVSAWALLPKQEIIAGKQLIHLWPSQHLALIMLIVLPAVIWWLGERFGVDRMRLLPAAELVLIPELLPRGAFDDRTFDGAFVVMVAMTVAARAFLRPQNPLSRFAAAAIWLGALVIAWRTHGSTAWFIWIGMTALVFWYEIQSPIRYPAAVLAVATGILIAVFAQPSGGLFDTSHRWQEWGLLLRTWWHDMPRLWGSGLGSYEWLGPIVEESHGVDAKNVLLWAHNDFIQIQLELGLVGSALTLWCTGDLLWQARKQPWVQIGLMGYGVLMMAQFPCHWVLSQLWGLYLVYLALHPADDLERSF